MRKSLFIFFALAFAAALLGCEDDYKSPTENGWQPDTGSVHVRKPNLYIYPSAELKLIVKIDFPNGGNIPESIPEYGNGWTVSVKPNGRINEAYDYLFYECRVPDLTQTHYGWVVARDSLEPFFENNMSLSGFNEKEIKDFTEYWIPVLKEFKYYEIYPQYKSTLDKMSVINFSVKPDNFFRLHYVIKGRNDNVINLLAPQAEAAERKGYFAVEWGVITK